MKHKKSHFLLWLSILSTFLLTSITSAQTSYLDSLDGKFALQFQISENFTLTNFQGTIFSGKYHLGKRSAVRLGLSFSLDDYDSENETSIGDSINSGQNSSYNGVDFRIYSQYIYYPVSVSDIGFYIGSGPFIGFGNNETEQTYEIFDSTADKSTNSNDLFTIGIDAIIGIEWSFNRWMTISAEYGLQLYYLNTTERTEAFDRVRERNLDSFRLTSSAVKFGISVYF